MSNFENKSGKFKETGGNWNKRYHGTGEVFDKFELQDSKNLGPNAIYFTPERSSAEYYARGKSPSIKEAFVDESNLFD